MLGLGTHTQSNYGWSKDSNGHPELWYFQGVVWKYVVHGTWPDQYFTYERQDAMSCKLYKVTYNASSGICSRTLVWDGNDGGQTPHLPITASTTKYSNLTFVSKDVFLITEENKAGSKGKKVYVHANKLTDNGGGSYTVTPKIWSRVLLEDTEYYDKNNPDASQNSYPGRCTGLAVIPPMSVAYDNLFDSADGNVHPAKAQVVALTGMWVEHDEGGGPWGGGQVGQNHSVKLLRLETDNSDIHNEGYADSAAWNAGATPSSSGDGAWKLIHDYGQQLDHASGWATLDSKANLFYGHYMGPSTYGTIGPSQPPTNLMSYLIPGEWDESACAEVRGPGADYIWDGTYNKNYPESWRYDDGNDDCGNPIVEHLFLHDTVIVPLTSSSDVRTVCSFEAGNGGMHTGLQKYNLWPSWDFLPQDYQADMRNTLMAEGGCCDIYGETEWGQDAIVTFVPRHSRIHWMGDDSWSPVASYNREGIHVFKQRDATNILDVVEFHGAQDSDVIVAPGRDRNGFWTQQMTMDDSWGVDPGAAQPDAGAIPLLEEDSSGPPYYNNENKLDTYVTTGSGLSFRPKWEL